MGFGMESDGQKQSSSCSSCSFVRDRIDTSSPGRRDAGMVQSITRAENRGVKSMQKEPSMNRWACKTQNCRTRRVGVQKRKESCRPTEYELAKEKLLILLSLGSNQKPSGCLDLAVITAERATNCATEDGEVECRFCGSNTVPPEIARLSC
jgi:hypothetical protein